jgi:L-Ala-D/L-Glu epimerase
MRENVLVRIGEGVGEGALPPYYGYDPQEVLAWLRSMDFSILAEADPLALEEVLNRIPAGPPPAMAAIDIALHDLWGKHIGQPLYRLFGTSPASFPLSSLTLSIPETEDELRQAVRDAAGFPILKLKLGTGSIAADEAIVRTVRSETNARLCVDANGAWTVPDAAQIIPRLAQHDLDFVEQPLHASTGAAAWHQLRKLLPETAPALFADESVQTAKDIIALAGAADGVNVKLAKAGGLHGARRMISVARAMDMQVMIGCMIESSAAVTAAAHLAGLADYADLDGHVNLASDPFTGVRLEDGRIILPQSAGLGVVPTAF